MYGSKFQWLIVGIYPRDWWRDDGSLPCPFPELKAALTGTIVMEMAPLASGKEDTVLNLVSTCSTWYCKYLG